MKPNARIVAAILLVFTFIKLAAGPAFPLVVSGRNLVDQNGRPFYMIGDAPQLLFVQLSTNDAITYLNDRAARGFNTLWVYPVDSYDQNNAPKNYYGNVPFDGADFTSEDANYWSLVDLEVNWMAARGMVAVMDPCFVGILVSDNYYLHALTNASDATLYAYGNFLGTRYKNFTNITWSMGGDADPNIRGLYAKLQDIAVAIHSNAPTHLITLEATRWLAAGGAAPNGGYSSIDACLVAFGSVPSWLNIDWEYRLYAAVQQGATNEYFRANALPVMMGEDTYEGPDADNMTPLMLRQEAYWECLQGCNIGRQMGNDAIWTFNCFQYPTNTYPTWQSMLGSPASLAEEYLGALFKSREFWLLVPDVKNTVLTAGYLSGTNLAVAAETSDRHTVVAYIPTYTTVSLAMTNLSGTNANAWWYNPSTGVATAIGTYRTTGTQTFTPPDTNDWVLVLDDASQNYPAPGVSGASAAAGTNTLSLAALGAGVLQLTVTGTTNAAFNLQSTTNLGAPWQTIGSGTTDVSGTFSTELNATSGASLFRTQQP